MALLDLDIVLLTNHESVAISAHTMCDDIHKFNIRIPIVTFGSGGGEGFRFFGIKDG